MRFRKLLYATFLTGITSIDLITAYDAESTSEIMHDAQKRNKMFLFNYDAFQNYKLAKDTILEDFTIKSQKTEGVYEELKNLKENELVKFSEATKAPSVIRQNITTKDVLLLDETGNIVLKEKASDPLQSTRAFIANKLIPIVLHINNRGIERTYKAALTELLLANDNIVNKLKEYIEKKIKENIEKKLKESGASMEKKTNEIKEKTDEMASGIARKINEMTQNNQLFTVISELKNEDLYSYHQFSNTLFMLYILNDVCNRFKAINDAASTIMSNESDLLYELITYQGTEIGENIKNTLSSLFPVFKDYYTMPLKIEDKKNIKQQLKLYIKDMIKSSRKTSNAPCSSLDDEHLTTLLTKIFVIDDFIKKGEKLNYNTNLIDRLKTRLDKFINVINVDTKGVTLKDNYIRDIWTNFVDELSYKGSKKNPQTPIPPELPKKETIHDCLAYLKGFELPNLLIRELVASDEEFIGIEKTIARICSAVDSKSESEKRDALLKQLPEILNKNILDLDFEILDDPKNRRSTINRLIGLSDNKLSLFQQLDILNKKAYSKISSLSEQQIKQLSSEEKLFPLVPPNMVEDEANYLKNWSKRQSLELYKDADLNSKMPNRLLTQYLAKYLFICCGINDKKVAEEASCLLPLAISDIRRQLELAQVFDGNKISTTKAISIDVTNWPKALTSDLLLSSDTFRIPSLDKISNNSSSLSELSEDEFKDYVAIKIFFEYILEQQARDYLQQVRDYLNSESKDSASKGIIKIKEYLDEIFSETAPPKNFEQKIKNFINTIRNLFFDKDETALKLPVSYKVFLAEELKKAILHYQWKDPNLRASPVDEIREAVLSYKEYSSLQAFFSAKKHPFGVFERLKSELSSINHIPSKDNKNIEATNGENATVLNQFCNLTDQDKPANYYECLLFYKTSLYADLTNESKEKIYTINGVINSLPLTGNKEFLFLLYNDLIDREKIYLKKLGNLNFTIEEKLNEISCSKHYLKFLEASETINDKSKTDKEKQEAKNIINECVKQEQSEIKKIVAEQKQQFYEKIIEIFKVLEDIPLNPTKESDKGILEQKVQIDGFTKMQEDIEAAIENIKQKFFPYIRTDSEEKTIFVPETFRKILERIIDIYADNVVDKKVDLHKYIHTEYKDNTPTFYQYCIENIPGEKIIKSLFYEIILNQITTKEVGKNRFILSLFTSIKNCLDRYMGVIIGQEGMKTLAFNYKTIEQQIAQEISNYNKNSSILKRVNSGAALNMASEDFNTLLQEIDDIIQNSGNYRNNYLKYLLQIFKQRRDRIKQESVNDQENVKSVNDIYKTLINDIDDYVKVENII